MTAMLFVLPWIAAAPVPKDFKKEAPKLDGSWKVTSYEVNGRPINSNVILSQTWTFEGEKLAISRPPIGNGVVSPVSKSTVKTDPKKSPMEIDHVLNASITRLGIYSIEGDKLTICLSLQNNGTERPANFDGGQRILKYVFTRATEKEKDGEKSK